MDPDNNARHRQILHLNPPARQHRNTAQGNIHKTQGLNPVLKKNTARLQDIHLNPPAVREGQNTARQEIHLNPIVPERENSARQQIHETQRLNPVVRDHEKTAGQEIHFNPVAREDDLDWLD